MASKENHNLEYDTLVSLNDKLTTGISSDRSQVLHKLVAEHVIAAASLGPSIEAEEVFRKVLEAVKINPESFEKFLRVIKECDPCIHDLVKLVRTTYDEKKQQKVQFIYCHCVFIHL